MEETHEVSVNVGAMVVWEGEVGGDGPQDDLMVSRCLEYALCGVFPLRSRDRLAVFLAVVALGAIFAATGCGTTSMEEAALLDKRCPGQVWMDSPLLANVANCAGSLAQRGGASSLVFGLSGVAAFQPGVDQTLRRAAAGCPAGGCSTVTGVGSAIGRNGEVYDAVTGACVNCGGNWAYWWGPNNTGWSVRNPSSPTVLRQFGEPADPAAAAGARLRAQGELEDAILLRNRTPGSN